MSDSAAPLPAQVKLPGPFGALLIGTWVNMALYTIELQQVWHLLRNYKDPFIIRLAALAALLTDTLCTAGSCAALYLYTITHWGDGPYLARQWWPIPVYVYTTGLTAGIVQAFLIYRFWVLSKNNFITAILGASALTALVSSLVTATWLVRFPNFSQRFTLKVPATIWFTSSAISDVSVAAALVWQLQRQKTGFKSTKSLVRRLTATAMKSGSACATIALVTMSLYLEDNQSQIAVGFAFCFGRVYSLTMLYNLNSRKNGRHTGTSSGGVHTTGDIREGAINLSGIQVQRSIRVDEDSRRAGTLEAERKMSEEEFYGANKGAPFAQV